MKNTIAFVEVDGKVSIELYEEELTQPFYDWCNGSICTILLDKRRSCDFCSIQSTCDEYVTYDQALALSKQIVEKVNKEKLK